MERLIYVTCVEGHHHRIEKRIEGVERIRQMSNRNELRNDIGVARKRESVHARIRGHTCNTSSLGMNVTKNWINFPQLHLRLRNRSILSMQYQL